MKISLVAFLSVMIVSIAGCVQYKKEPGFQSELARDQYSRSAYGYRPDNWIPYHERYTQRFKWKMQYIARQLGSKVLTPESNVSTVLMTSIVPTDNLYKATSFGRLCTEQLITELSKQGFKVIEARKTDVYLLRDNEGEFSLSRDAYWLSREFKADAVLVGVYSKSGGQALINVRLVDSRDSHILGTASAHMNLKGDRFLNEIFLKEANASNTGGGGTGEMRIRKKVDSEKDSYAEVLEYKLGNMAGEIKETSEKKIENGKTIAVATFVDVDNFYRATTFGRYVTEQLMYELYELGYNVLEIRNTPDLFVDLRIGELGLSREMSQIIKNRKADAVVVGTYTRGGDSIAVNSRLVIGKTQEVVGIGQIIVDSSPRNKFVTAMLKNEVTTVMPTEMVEGF